MASLGRVEDLARPVRRRDRRGRGLRGPLAPAGAPLNRSRAERFDDLVLDAVEDLEKRWGPQLEGVEFAVEDVPPPAALSLDGDVPVPLSALLPAVADGRGGEHPPRIVIYRRAVEARALDRLDLADLVRDCVVDEVAELLGIDPDVLDPPS